MRILHIFDHSIPLHSGYTFRSAAILREQRALGWETFHLTGPRQIDCAVAEETVDGLPFPRAMAAPSVLPPPWAGSGPAPLVAHIYPCISYIIMQELQG